VTLAHYFSRAFAGRFLAVLLGFAAVLQLLDLLDSAGTVLEQGRGVMDMLTYIGLRMPMIVNQIIPLAVLIASLGTLFSFARRGEITALRSAGASPWLFLKLLFPMVTIIIVLHVLLLGQVVPKAEQTLRDWWATHVAPPETQDTARPVWVRVGRDIISIATVGDAGHHLADVTILSRDDQGRAYRRIVAREGRWEEGRWMLHDADIMTFKQGTPRTDHKSTLPWPDGPSPDNVAFVAAPPHFLTPQRSLSILRGAWSGTRRLSYYETQLQTILSIPVSSLVMLLLAQPASRGLRRGERFGAGLATGLTLGLAFLLVQGLLSALAETNTLPPTLAVWSPLILFASIGGTILLYLEE